MITDHDECRLLFEFDQVLLQRGAGVSAHVPARTSRPVRDEWSRDGASVTRLECKLFEVSAVSFPAFDGAVISGVLSAHPQLTVEDAARRLNLILKAW
jgi:hypothetical protein